MPCYSPLRGFASRHLTANGKRKITFDRSGGYVDMPMTVPCGSCIGCRIDRSRQWALRCVHESKSHARSSFLTLTYNDQNLPPGNSLVKSDLQNFFKRLRNSCGPFRYYACGEYGEKDNRPHYHVICFGLDFSEDRKKFTTNSRGDYLYKSQNLTDIWDKGHCLLGLFNYSTAAYTARYCMKKMTGKDSALHYTRVDLSTGEEYQVLPEFALMSLKPGIGADWYEKYKKDAFPSDFLIHEGKKHSVPRYYADKLKREDETTYKVVKTKRKVHLKNFPEHNTPDRLYTRELCKLSQIKTLTRNI